MIIKKLVLENFLSYFDKTEIIFPEYGFFLISGPTGSGKTTILEAISFAIFGKIPRYDNSEFQLEYVMPKNELTKRNQYLKTEVTVELILDKKYYITRTIEFKTKKGETKAEQTVVLRTDDQVLAAKVKEYEEKICKILGLTNIKEAYQSFTKSIFLPQNAFDKFLYLKQSEREKLILELLNLNIYEKIKNKIKEEYSNLKLKMESIRNDIQIKQKELQEKEEEIQKFPYLDKIHKLDEQINSMIPVYKMIHNEIKETFPNLVQLERYLKSLSEKEFNLGNLSHYEKLKEFHHSLSIQFKYLYDNYQEIEKEKQISYGNLKHFPIIQNFLEELDNPDPYYFAKDTVDELLKNIKANSELEEEIQKLNEQRKQSFEKLIETQKYREKLEHESLQKQKEIENLEKKQKEIEDLISEQEKRLGIKEKAVEIQEYIKEKKLNKCLVCSSILNEQHHHFINKSTQEANQKISEKKHEIQQNKKNLEKIKKQIKEIEENIKSIEKKLSYYESKIKIENELREELETKLKKLTTQKSEIQNFLSSKEYFIKLIQQTYQEIYGESEENPAFLLEKFYRILKNFDKQKKLVDMLKRYSNTVFNPDINYLKELDFLKELSLNLEEIQKLINLLKKIFHNANDYSQIEEIITNPQFSEIHQKTGTNLKKLKIYIQELEQNQNILNNLTEEIQKIQSNLEKILDLKQYALDLELDLIKEYQIQLGNSQIYLKEMEELKEHLQNTPHTDVKKINQILEEIFRNLSFLDKIFQENIEFLENEKAKIEKIIDKFKRVEDLRNEIQRKEEEQKSLSQEFEIIKTLYEDFGGGGKSKDFISFVFNYVFEMVKEKANKILEELTESRYNLIFSKEKEEIEIIDNWFNNQRNVRSLSGGEKFLVSLSIAMAISQLMSISKYKVKSLFIDEGFGTLDQNTLNDIMDYLENYFFNLSDKVLGIITHVEEIKERFNYVINVKKQKDGSKVEIISKI